MKLKKLSKYNHPMLFITSIIIVALVLVGCGSATEVTNEAPPTTQVQVQLSWLHTIEFAGFYVAEAEGYFAKEGLEVQLSSGGYDSEGNSIDPINQVVSGKADFGLTDGGVLLKARADGAPIVAIATVYQRSPIALVSLGQDNIAKPEDLIGATVHIDDYTSGVVYQALLAAQGIDPSQVNTVPRVDFTTAPLLNGEADVIDGWVTNELVSLKLEDREISAILPSDYGIDIYPDVIFTTEDMITNNPALVESFVRATVRGMQDAIDDPEKAAALAVTYDETLDLDHETAAMFQSLPLLNPIDSQPGMMHAENWETAHQILLRQDILSEPLDVNAAYTLTFLEKVYDEIASN